MQKTLIALALTLVCVAATAATYYYGRYLPRLHEAELAEKRRKTDLENAQRCNKDASKFWADLRKDYMSSGLFGPTLNWNDPDMHFSKQLNTCLVEITFKQWVVPAIAGAEGRELINQAVYDIYSNRVIVSVDYTIEKGGEEKPLFPLGMDSKKYSAEKDKLFSE